MGGNRYSGKIRIRSCGILIEEEKILLVKLHSPVTNELIWIPPGGKVEFGESLSEALKREFNEETGVEVSVRELLNVNELIKNDIHAIEFYYLVEKTGGELKMGSDPEVSEQDQIIKDLRYFTRQQVKHIHTVPDFISEGLWEMIKAKQAN
jgi:8-oxo-dGTP diphosphatase